MWEFIKIGLLSFIGLWIIFANLVVLKNNYIKSAPNFIQTLFKVLLAAPFIILDVIFNIIYGTVLFLQLPQVRGLKGWTFTERCSNILEEEWSAERKSWRFHIAHFICKYMLEFWDFNHCGLAMLKGIYKK